MKLLLTLVPGVDGDGLRRRLHGLRYKQHKPYYRDYHYTDNNHTDNTSIYTPTRTPTPTPTHRTWRLKLTNTWTLCCCCSSSGATKKYW